MRKDRGSWLLNQKYTKKPESKRRVKGGIEAVNIVRTWKGGDFLLLERKMIQPSPMRGEASQTPVNKKGGREGKK